jgi:hypothetical protein
LQNNQGHVSGCRVHGHIDHESAIGDMVEYHYSGFTTRDLADIYGPAEDFIGDFGRRLFVD